MKHAILNLLQQLATALGVLTSAKELATTIGWSLALWGSVAAGNLLVFRAFGLPFGVSETLFVLGWSMIGSAIPTPGGAAGAFHAVTGGALILLVLRLKRRLRSPSLSTSSISCPRHCLGCSTFCGVM